MKHWLQAFVFVLVLAGPLWAPINPARLNISDEDGVPSLYPWQLRVTNGSLTDNGDGTASLSTAGGSAGATGSITAANQFSLPYYSLVGSSNVLSGFPGVTMSTNTGVFISTLTVTSSATVLSPFTISITTRTPIGTKDYRADFLYSFVASTSSIGDLLTANMQVNLSTTTTSAIPRFKLFVTTTTATGLLKLDPFLSMNADKNPAIQLGIGTTGVVVTSTTARLDGANSVTGASPVVEVHTDGNVFAIVGSTFTVYPDINITGAGGGLGLGSGNSGLGRVILKAPDALFNNDVLYALPSAQGTSGQTFVNDGAGNLTWQTPSGGSGSGIVSPGTFTWVNTSFGISVSTVSVSTISVSGSASIDNNLMITHGTNASTMYVFQAPDATSFWAGQNQNMTSIYGPSVTGIGAGAVGAGCAGGFCTGVGNGACGAVAAGVENSCFAYASGTGVTDGSFGIYFGPNSDPSNVHGSRITAIGGVNAIYFNTADDVIGIGSNSGVPGGSGTNQTTATKNIFIGNTTGLFGGNWTNAGAIGHGAQVRGSNALQLGGLPGSTFEWLVQTTSASIDYALTVGSNTILPGATFYQNAPAIISSATVVNQFKSLGGLFISTGPVIRSTYTLTSNDSVILASAAPNGNITIQLPASASSNGGQYYSITKVDRSTGSITIQINGTDLISNTTGTMTLNAPGQSLNLLSDGGVSGWQAFGRVPVTPSFLGDPADPNAGTAIQVANDARCQAYTTSDFSIATSVRFSVGVQSGNMDVGMYDNKGGRLASSGSTAVPAIGVAGISFTGKAYMAPGIVWLCVAIDNIIATLRAPTSDSIVGTCEIASSFPLPATLAIQGCTAATKKFSVIATIQGGPQT